jgi:hypothetical protein
MEHPEQTWWAMNGTREWLVRLRQFFALRPPGDLSWRGINRLERRLADLYLLLGCFYLVLSLSVAIDNGHAWVTDIILGLLLLLFVYSSRPRRRPTSGVITVEGQAEPAVLVSSAPPHPAQAVVAIALLLLFFLAFAAQSGVWTLPWAFQSGTFSQWFEFWVGCGMAALLLTMLALAAFFRASRGWRTPRDPQVVNYRLALTAEGLRFSRTGIGYLFVPWDALAQVGIGLWGMRWLVVPYLALRIPDLTLVHVHPPMKRWRPAHWLLPQSDLWLTTFGTGVRLSDTLAVIHYYLDYPEARAGIGVAPVPEEAFGE